MTPCIWPTSKNALMFQQRRKRRLIDAKDDTGKAQVAELHGEAQAVGRAAPLPNDGQVGVAKRVLTNQFFLGIWQCQQAVTLGNGQDRTAWHDKASLSAFDHLIRA